jgi:hypothetical protein
MPSLAGEMVGHRAQRSPQENAGDESENSHWRHLHVDYFLVDFAARLTLPSFLDGVLFFATRCCGGVLPSFISE